MKKGDLVVVLGRQAEPPRAHALRAMRHITDEEVCEWRLSPLSKGMNSAGETKLPPTSVAVLLHADRHYVVLKARCRPVFGHWRASKMTKVKCTVTGEEAFIKRDKLIVISEI